MCHCPVIETALFFCLRVIPSSLDAFFFFFPFSIIPFCCRACWSHCAHAYGQTFFPWTNKRRQQCKRRKKNRNARGTTIFTFLSVGGLSTGKSNRLLTPQELHQSFKSFESRYQVVTTLTGRSKPRNFFAI